MKTTLHFAALAAFLTLLAPTLRAQSTIPVLTIHDAEVFEGNSGTTDLVFNVTLDRVSIIPVTATVSFSSVTLVPGGTSPATPGAAPDGSVDFLNPGSVPITFRPGNTTQSVTVTVFGDTTVEPDEILALVVQNIVGARTTAGSNSAISAFPASPPATPTAWMSRRATTSATTTTSPAPELFSSSACADSRHFSRNLRL